MEPQKPSFRPLSVVFSLLGATVLLFLELVLTLLVYSGLNLYSLDLFGGLVRFARTVLDLMTLFVEKVLPGSVNQAYATLFGELGPKSILLLLIGLLVAGLVRTLTHVAGSMRR